jgi:DNA mismatch repair protein MutL
MSDVIRLLPDSVANQIAAGEVIQRPASVIKELVENAVDAGAHSIKIILRDGGKNLIQVIDDGCGMSDTDARLAFERHATSKINQAADLFSLHTMGFRGEALPSIAAVAQVELRTMRQGDSIGTHLEIAASKFESQTPDACPVGTNLAVKNLFFNFPARRKFLKKDSVELTHIIHEFERLALVNPDKEFLLVHNDVTLHQLLPGSLKQRIVDLFGKALDSQLIPVSTETSLVKITGFVSNPKNARKRNALQYFFVNGRNMRHPYFQKAVLHCYEELIPTDQQPNFFLNFEVDASTIDVNIHPTKSEIKFENEAPIWQILVAAIKESLGKFNAVPSIDFDTSDAIDIPIFNPSESPDFAPLPSNDYNPFAPENTHRSATTPSRKQPSSALGDESSGLNNIEAFQSASDDAPVDAGSKLNNWDALYDSFQNGTKSDNDNFNIDDIASPINLDFLTPTGGTEPEQESALNSFYDPYTPEAQPATPNLPDMDTSTMATGGSLLQLRNKYIIVPSRNGLMVIDRYRAHVKVLTERYAAFTANSLGESQQVLFPETITLSAAQNVTLETMLDDLKVLGFDLSFLGDNVWAINALPPSVSKLNPVDTIQRMIDNVSDETVDGGTTGDLHRRVALSMARTAAIQPGQAITDAEAEALLGEFFSLPDPAYSPDGLPTYFTIDMAELTHRLS